MSKCITENLNTFIIQRSSSNHIKEGALLTFPLRIETPNSKMYPSVYMQFKSPQEAAKANIFWNRLLHLPDGISKDGNRINGLTAEHTIGVIHFFNALAIASGRFNE